MPVSDIIRKYADRLAYWVSEPDAGMYDGLQKGLSRCTGEVMAWINSDDLLHPHAFSIAAEVFSAFPAVEWIQGIPTVVDEAGRTVYVKDFRKWSKYHYFLQDKEHIQQESCFWKKSLWERAGGKLNTQLKYAGDYELWSRFFEHAELYCMRATLGAFRARSSGQLSMEKMGQYNAEVKQVWQERMTRLSAEEKEKLGSMTAVEKKSFFGAKSKVLARPGDFAPRAISFDRSTQKFVLE